MRCAARRVGRLHGARRVLRLSRRANAHALAPRAEQAQQFDGLGARGAEPVRHPGTALDAGAGEGADAIWLAERGWQVTAVDVSGVALGRAAGHAAKAGDEVAARIRWQHEDLLEWTPPERAYDLVTSQYLHLPGAFRHTLFARLAAAVRDGGTLLIVGHHPADLKTTLQRPNHPELLFTGDELASEIGGDGWEIVTNVAAERETTDQDGRP